MYKYSAVIAGRLLLVALGASALAGEISAQTSVRRVAILDSKDAVEIEVESSDKIVPQTRVLDNPERLVIDFPNATPGAELRSQSVERGQVKDLRIGLFASKPPVTRLVLDLKSAQTYQVFPSGRTVIIKVMNGGAVNGEATNAGVIHAGANGTVNAAAGNDPYQPKRPGLVAANFTAAADAVHVDVVAKPPLEVTFRTGLLSIRSDKATLAAVLAAIQQRTGAEVSIPPGADQEKVVVNLGPGPAQEVISQLLHGSKFNFLILSAANDPGRLDRVVLTPRGESGGLMQMQALQPMQSNESAQMDDPNPPQQIQPHPEDFHEQESRAANMPRQAPDMPPTSGDDPPPEE
jgi:hypothetical protein